VKHLQHGEPHDDLDDRRGAEPALATGLDHVVVDQRRAEGGGLSEPQPRLGARIICRVAMLYATSDLGIFQ
jgi:hypothetical protein